MIPAKIDKTYNKRLQEILKNKSEEKSPEYENKVTVGFAFYTYKTYN